MVNDLAYVRRVLDLLSGHGIETWLFGGWAEELHGMIDPRPHKDIDLLYPANDFQLVEMFLSKGLVDEIVEKRFPHKRAFELDGVMTELFLVERDDSAYYTNFWGDQRYDWPADVHSTAQGISAASTTALTAFRTKTWSPVPTVDGVVVSVEEWTRHHQ